MLVFIQNLQEGAVEVVLTRTMDISFDQDVYTTNTVQLHLFIFVVTPVTHLGHVLAFGIDLWFVPFYDETY
jgi:hypothetical protein